MTDRMRMKIELESREFSELWDQFAINLQEALHKEKQTSSLDRTKKPNQHPMQRVTNEDLLAAMPESLKRITDRRVLEHILNVLPDTIQIVEGSAIGKELNLEFRLLGLARTIIERLNHLRRLDFAPPSIAAGTRAVRRRLRPVVTGRHRRKKRA